MEIRENNFNVQECKRQLRKEKFTQRDSLDSNYRKSSNQIILERTLSHSFYQNSNCILCYASYKSEVSTFELIQSAIAEGKNVFVPKVVGRDMDFFQIQSLEQLVKGYKGIPEPGNEMTSRKFNIQDEPLSKILMIVPGAVFDMNKNRIGYGKGFYDRYLAKNDRNHRIIKIAYAYEIQIVDSIITEESDQRVDYILTEKRFF